MVHRVPLPGRERSLAQVPVDRPAAHRRLAPASAGAHQRDRLALVGHGPVGGDAVSSFEAGRIVQPALALESVDGPFDLGDGRRTGAPGECGREQVGPGEHRVALRKMGERPVHRLAHGIGTGGVFEQIGLARGFGRGVLARILRPAAHLLRAAQPLLHRLRDQRPRIEAERGGLFLPGLAQFRPVDVALALVGLHRLALFEF